MYPRPFRRTANLLTNLALFAFVLSLAGPALQHFDRAQSALATLRAAGG